MAGQREINLADDLEDTYYGDVLSELEHRKLGELEDQGGRQRVIREAAEIEFDLTSAGPLGRYMKSRREDAKEALRVLATTNPKDGVTIALAQASVNEYLRAVAWIAERLDEASDAERSNGEDTDG